MATIPNFFIFGAARCGTTTLHQALRTHPEIAFATQKEPSFFCRPFQIVKNPLDYVDLFAGVGDAKAIGEASTPYISHPDTPGAIRAFIPEAKFIGMFRHPADRAHALYLYIRSQGWERIRTFERALAAEDRRFASARFARRCPQYFWSFMYYRSGLYGEQLERWFSHFPREQFYLLTLQQLLADPTRVLGEIHDFLGVERRPTELPWAGKSTAVRSNLVEVLHHKVVEPITRHRIPLEPFGRLQYGVMRRVNSRLGEWNQAPAPTLDPALRAELARRYEPDLERFHALTGLELRPTP